MKDRAMISTGVLLAAATYAAAQLANGTSEREHAVQVLSALRQNLQREREAYVPRPGEVFNVLIEAAGVRVVEGFSE